MPAKLTELLMDDSFVRFLKGTCTEEEYAQWTAWMQENEEHAKNVMRGRKLLNEGALNLDKPKAIFEFRRLKKRIGAMALKNSIDANPMRSNSRKVVWLSMAAAAAFLMVVGFLSYKTWIENEKAVQSQLAQIEYRTITTEAGDKTSIQYSDGSSIVLNANSELKLPKKTTDSDTLQVWLEGEALFSVTRKPDSKERIFIVNTRSGSVSVLGTKFAVNTMKTEDRVVLAEGSVKIDVQDQAKNVKLEYVMKPGELALYSSELDEIQVSRVNSDVYTSWAGDTLILDNTPLYDLIERIEFTYDVTVHVEVKDIMSKKLTGRFENVNLEFLLNGLAQALDVDITKSDRKIYIKAKNIDSDNRNQE